MKYAQHRAQINSSKTKKSKMFFIVILLVFIVLIVVILFFLIKSNNSGLEVIVNDDEAEILDLDSEILVIEENDVFFEEIDLQGIGLARRGISSGLFTHVIVADLPLIDLTSHFYEGWLVNPQTLEFFSTGEMFPREDGKWGLVWEKKGRDLKDLKIFSQIIITLEVRDGDDSPSSTHVINANF